MDKRSTAEQDAQLKLALTGGVNIKPYPLRLPSISGAGGLEQHLRLSTLANGGVVPVEISCVTMCRAHIGMTLCHEPTTGPQQLLRSHQPGASPKLPLNLTFTHFYSSLESSPSVSFTGNLSLDHHSKSSLSVHVSHLGFSEIFNESHLTLNRAVPLVRPPELLPHPLPPPSLNAFILWAGDTCPLSSLLMLAQHAKAPADGKSVRVALRSERVRSHRRTQEISGFSGCHFLNLSSSFHS